MSDSTRRRAQLATRLHARKQPSVGQLMFQAARLWNEHAMTRLMRKVPAARLAHAMLLAQLDLDGTRQTELARRAGISKQAVGQLVDELVALGMVRRDPDPRDRRALLVRFTDDGIAQLIAGLDVVDELELELGGDVGSITLDRLRRELIRLIPALERLQP